MKFQVGERLPGSGPSGQPGGYLITEVLHEAPWATLYAARKILYNFDFANQRCRETDAREWLDVLVRSVNYDDLDTPQNAARRRQLARNEVCSVLANRASNLWPEPVDLLELAGVGEEVVAGEEAAEEEREPVAVLARPHGERLGDWLGHTPTLAARLALVAELLSFVAGAHAEGFLLNGLGPDAFVVDRQGRVGYLASDRVLRREQGRLVEGRWPWAELFPPDRYPRGFAAPECHEAARPRDERGDWFAWAALAYCIATGDPKGAEAQDEPWFQFKPAHAVRLEQILRGLAPAQVGAWAAASGADPPACTAAWPGNLVRVVQRCLAAEPTDRPAGLSTILRWLVAPPPPPPVAAIALRLAGTDVVRIGYELPVNKGLLEGVVLRQGPPDASGEIQEAVVGEGPAAGWIDVPAKGDGTGPYRLRLRTPDGGPLALSEGVTAPLVEPVPRELRRLAESAASLARPGDPEPTHVALLFRVVRWSGVADAMLSSVLPAVRGWATARAAAALEQPVTAADAEPLLWRALQDDHVHVRQLASRALLRGELSPERIARLFEELARRPVDEAEQALATLRQRGADARLVRRGEETATTARTVACPECSKPLPQRDLPAHLQQAHGYLEVGGAVLPRGGALAQLWERVFAEGDRNAHDRLCRLLLAPDGGGPPAYVRALAGELERRADRLDAARWQEMPRLTQCLRSNPAAVPLFAQLLRVPDRRVRDVARELLLGELATRLAGSEITALHVRAQLERLCPPEQLEDAIQLCRQLSRTGVKAEPVKECLRQLEEQRPVPCEVCGARVPRAQLETHLRRAHRIYQFRGQQRPLQEMLGVLLDRVCGRRPDHEAWATLETLIREEYPEEAEGYLATWLGQSLQRIPAGKRDRRTGAAADAIAAAAGGQRTAVVLAGMTASDWQAAGFQLALEIALRLPTPLTPAVLAAVQPRLADKRLPDELRLRAAAHLLRTTGPSGPGADKLLRFLVAGPGKARHIDRLQELEQLTGKLPAIDRLCTELEDQLRMSCPRCGVELRRVEMERHLWDEHRLILDGRRVREPWRVVEDWLEDYRVEGDADQLERCRRLAGRLDSHDGPGRLQRLMLQHGIEDARARTRLLREARDGQASLCPHCFALVPVPERRLPPTLACEHDLIEGEGYRVETSDNGLMPTLEIEIPNATVYDGREPGRLLTRAGAFLLFALPLLMLAILLLVLPLGLDIAWYVPGLAVGGLFFVVVGMIFLSGEQPNDPLNRVIDHAWRKLVPTLLEMGLARDDHAFLAGLAQCSIGHGDIAGRADALEQVRAAMDKVVAEGPVPASFLGAVWRLTIEDAAEDEEGQDTLPVLAGQADRCFDGGLPLSFLTTLLAPLENETWSVADERRLRVLLCQRAFDAGLEVRELLDLGRLQGTLSRTLDLKQTEYIAHLRLLRTLQATRPWERVGRATAIFEIVKHHREAAALLERLSDVVLRVDNVPGLYLCGRGVNFEGAWILEPPQQIDIIDRSLFAEGGFHLVIGSNRFWYAEDPTPVVSRLEKWLRYFFRDFRPQLAGVYRGRSPAAARRLLARNGVRCPDCRRRVLPVLGELGITADPPRHEEAVVVLAVPE
jgi:hypothetical protein